MNDKVIRVGILGAADIAAKRFLTALAGNPRFRLAGIAASTADERGDRSYSGSDEEKSLKKAEELAGRFGGKVFRGYRSLLSSDEADAVYIPLPPAFHARWGSEAVNSGKHIFMEKPFTTGKEETGKLIKLAEEKETAVFENYGFVLHDQFSEIKRLLREGRIGDVRLIRAMFGFPRRAKGDFRYIRALGGGALLDCGGYTLRAAAELMGDNIRVVSASLGQIADCDADGYGSAMLTDGSGLTAQIGFGMDQQYRCELEIWGQKGTIRADRIFTAPADLTVKISVVSGMQEEKVEVAPDDQFSKALDRFWQCTEDPGVRKQTMKEILMQGSLVEELQSVASTKLR